MQTDRPDDSFPATFDPFESLADVRHEFGEHGGVNMSIEASTTFTVMSAGTMPEIFHGQRGPDAGGCYLYGRHFNPTVYVLGRQIAAIEDAPAGYCTASGMSAVSGAILQSCDAEDEIVASNTLYGGTYALLHDFLPAKAGIRTTFVDATDPASVEAACTERTRVLFVESMSNPMLRVADTPALADIAHRFGARLIVDNTFCPLIISPLRLGADVVVHSATKFINGASDIIAGVICSDTEFIASLMDLHTGALMLLGPTMDPRAAFEISLRLPHLGLRIKEHSRRAAVFAERLRDLGIRVIYPGLPDHPDHELLTRLANPEYGHGGVLCVDLGTPERASRLMNVLQNEKRFGFMAVSLGFSDTLMSCSASSTSSEMPPEALDRAGIVPGLVRISIGYTGSVEQRWHQFREALDDIGAVASAAGGTV